MAHGWASLGSLDHIDSIWRTRDVSNPSRALTLLNQWCLWKRWQTRLLETLLHEQHRPWLNPTTWCDGRANEQCKFLRRLLSQIEKGVCVLDPLTFYVHIAYSVKSRVCVLDCMATITLMQSTAPWHGHKQAGLHLFIQQSLKPPSFPLSS